MQLPPTLYQKSYTNHTLPGSTDPEHFDPKSLAPYVYVDEISGTIPELLSLGDSFKETGMKEGPVVVFPKRLERTDWVSLRDSLPIVSKGMWEPGTPGDFDLEEVHNKLGLWQGITRQDKDLVVVAIRSISTHPTHSLLNLWE